MVEMEHISSTGQYPGLLPPSIRPSVHKSSGDISGINKISTKRKEKKNTSTDYGNNAQKRMALLNYQPLDLQRVYLNCRLVDPGPFQ